MTRDRLSFGLFDFDPIRGVLRRDGERSDLRPQPARALSLLLERAGEIVSREELREHLWGSEVFVDFEAGLNTCIRRLRAALGDEADEPHFIQTVPGRGYRFIASVQRVEIAEEHSAPAVAPSSAEATIATASANTDGSRVHWTAITLVAALLLLLGLLPTLGRRLSSDDPDTLEDTQPVLLADFQSSSGEPSLDAALAGLLRDEIGRTEGLRLLDPTEIDATLGRMKLEPDVEIDREVGVEVCQRARVSTLVVGSLEPVDGRLSLQIEVVDAETNRSVITRSSLEEHTSAVRRRLPTMVEEVRGELAEFLATRAPMELLADVTTRDLEALRAYSRAMGLGPRDPVRVALLRRATALDPDFAMAQSKLGVAEMDAGNTRAAVSHFRTAADNSVDLTRFEQLYVSGHMAGLEMDGEGALHAWSQMSDAFPELAIGHVNLGAALLFYRNDFAGCYDSLNAVQLTSLPDNPRSLVRRNIIVCLMGAGRLDEALQAAALEELQRSAASVGPMLALGRHVEAVEALERAERNGELEEMAFDLERAAIHADQLELDHAIQSLERVVAQSAARDTHSRLAYQLKLFAYFEAAGRQGELRSGLADAFEEVRELADRELPPSTKAVPAMALLGGLAARNGQAELARKIQGWILDETTGLQIADSWQPYLALLEAEILHAQGRPAEAAERLQTVVTQTTAYPLHTRATLARSYLAAGNSESAAEEKRYLASQRGRALVECLGAWQCLDDAMNLLAVGAAARDLGSRAGTLAPAIGGG